MLILVTGYVLGIVSSAHTGSKTTAQLRRDDDGD